MKEAVETANPLRAVVIDDSALYRKVVSDVLAGMPGIEVVAVARNGLQGLEKIEQLRPDFVTVDLEMPELDGIGMLRQIAARKLDVLAIVVSAFSAQGAKSTTAALEVGAFDFVLKPQGSSLEQSIEQLRQDLQPKLAACFALKRRKASRQPSTNVRNERRSASDGRIREASEPVHCRPKVVAIGVSTGGPKALGSMLPQLPGDFPLPIVLVQHMPPMFTKSLADELNRHCALNVCEAADGDVLRPANVYIAPGGSQMKVVRTAAGHKVQITDDPPERNCKPSVDYLFRSVAESFGSNVLGVIMTGMGDDGTLGSIELKRKGGAILAQHERGCTVYGMPRQVIEEGLADIITPLTNVASQICIATGVEVTV